MDKIKFYFRDYQSELVAEWKRWFEDVSEVTAERGDIFDVSADAVVSPANSFGFMDGGIDKVYIYHFGEKLQTRLQEIIRDERGGELLVGDALVVPTGDQKVQFLVSAPTMRAPMDVAETANAYLAFRAVLRAVDQHNASHPIKIASVLCPGLGTATGRMPAAVCAKQMRRAYARHHSREMWFPRTVRQAMDDQREMLHGN